MSRKNSDFLDVLKLEGEEILRALDRFSQEKEGKNIEKCLNLLESATRGGGKILVTGVGKSGKVAQKIAASLSSTGTLAVFLHPTEGLHGDLGLLQEGDALLALSYSGNTDELLKLVPSIKERKISIVGIGGNVDSRLAKVCDGWIDGSVSAEACPHGLAPTTSTTLALAIGDAIAVALMKRKGFEAKDFAKNHPGGGLGRRLHLKVEEIMHKGEALSVVTRNTKMDEVVVSSTEKKLGIVLVAENDKLLGVITDGDIRRALQAREKFFDLEAYQVMTPSPVSIHPDSLAIDALQLMENRKSQISVLPVIDHQNRWKGVVRIHDLVGSF